MPCNNRSRDGCQRSGNGLATPLTEDEIRLTLPAAAEFARLARLTVAGLATRIGFSYDEVEDLRIAVGEACSLLVTPERGGDPLELVFRVRPSRLDINVSGPIDPRLAAEDGLSRQILEAVVDEFELDQDGVRLVKMRR